MPHVSQMMQSKYLTKEDCYNKPVVTIRTVQAEQFGGRQGQGAETKWIMYFNEANKGLKLNPTIIKVMAAAFGETTEAWVGKRVMLYVDQTVMMAGQVVGGVRVQPPRNVPTEVGHQMPGAFKSSAFAQPAAAAAAPAPGATFNPQTGEVLHPSAGAAPLTAPPAVVDPEFDDPVPF